MVHDAFKTFLLYLFANINKLFVNIQTNRSYFSQYICEKFQLGDRLYYVTDKKFVATGFEVAITKLPLYGGLRGVECLDTLHYQISRKRLTLINERQKQYRFGLKRIKFLNSCLY